MPIAEKLRSLEDNLVREKNNEKALYMSMFRLAETWRGNRWRESFIPRFSRIWSCSWNSRSKKWVFLLSSRQPGDGGEGGGGPQGEQGMDDQGCEGIKIIYLLLISILILKNIFISLSSCWAGLHWILNFGWCLSRRLACATRGGGYK